MLALFSKFSPIRTKNWSSRIAAPLQDVEKFYKYRTDIPRKKRRELARFNLYKLDGFDSEAVNAILEQWDISLKSSNKDNKIARSVEMPIGECLKKASLLTPVQIEIALMEQQNFSEERFGDIISRHGWLKHQTIEFFVNRLPKIRFESYRFPLGRYLIEAGLLEPDQVRLIVTTQNKSLHPLLFGSIAASKGYVKKVTIDFIIKHLPRR